MKLKHTIPIVVAVFSVAFVATMALRGWRNTPPAWNGSNDVPATRENQLGAVQATPDEATRRWLNSQRVPDATTPFRQRMRDSGYAYDPHTHQWYKADLAATRYHCTWAFDNGADGLHPETYLDCPNGRRPPGIPDQP